jgi:hypothetical protein
MDADLPGILQNMAYDVHLHILLLQYPVQSYYQYNNMIHFHDAYMFYMDVQIPLLNNS